MPYEFKRSDVYGLASALGAETHERGEELFFRWCPYCKGGGHDKNTFSVNLENGAFKCFRAGCGAQGHLVQLARDFGYPLEFDDGRKKKYRTLPQRPVKVTNPAVRYLESRGISRAVTERYRITTQRGHDNILVFPFYDGDGVMQFVKYRKTDFVKGRDRYRQPAYQKRNLERAAERSGVCNRQSGRACKLVSLLARCAGDAGNPRTAGVAG